jgi:hypothetical protein
LRGCLILALAGLGFALGYALAPRHLRAAAPPMTHARAARKVMVAIPAPTPARVPAALAMRVHHRRAASATSARQSGTAARPTASAAAAAPRTGSRSVQTPPATTQPATPPPTTTSHGTTTDPFNGQSHPKTGGSSTDGQSPPP